MLSLRAIEHPWAHKKFKYNTGDSVKVQMSQEQINEAFGKSAYWIMERNGFIGTITSRQRPLRHWKPNILYYIVNFVTKRVPESDFGIRYPIAEEELVRVYDKGNETIVIT